MEKLIHSLKSCRIILTTLLSKIQILLWLEFMVYFKFNLGYYFEKNTHIITIFLQIIYFKNIFLNSGISKITLIMMENTIENVASVLKYFTLQITIL